MLGTMLGFLFCVTAKAEDQPTEASAQTTSTPTPGNSSSALDDRWHVSISPYLWFAGIHGTVGIRGHDVSVNASAKDVLSYFNIGLMGAIEARKQHFVFTADGMWIKLSDEKALPINDREVQSIKAKMTQVLLTPKIGYRVVDSEKLKIDALWGIRYWHQKTGLSFEPNLFGGVSDTKGWVDVVGGTKIQMSLSPKVLVTIAGDAGGGSSALDYQVAGFLGYRIGKKYVLQAGWRYFDVNYRSQGFTYDVAQSGLVLGLTINLK
jgi:hypothetical protein